MNTETKNGTPKATPRRKVNRAVLGTMTARLHSLPKVGQEHVVVGAARGESGRKRMSAVSLYDSAGGRVATAEHVWIAVDPKAFN